MARLRAEMGFSDDGVSPQTQSLRGKYLGRIRAVEKKLMFDGVP
jgi:hypothetical protein